MKEEHAKNKKGRNHATIKQLMEKTRQRRWKSILDKGPFVSDVLKEFPFLTSSKVLRREFRWVAEVDGSTSSLTSSWPDWKKQIIELSKAEGATRPSIKKLHDLYMANAEVGNPTDHSDSVTLEILIKLLYPKGPAKGCIFIKKFEACDVDLDGEVNKITQSAPYIIQTGTAGTENAQYFIACEQMILCESKSNQDSIIDLIATYYTFNICYPKAISGILLFFQHYVFDLKDAQPLPSCTLKLVNCLNKISVL